MSALGSKVSAGAGASASAVVVGEVSVVAGAADGVGTIAGACSVTGFTGGCVGAGGVAATVPLGPGDGLGGGVSPVEGALLGL
jgi:hypothetical protein